GRVVVAREAGVGGADANGAGRNDGVAEPGADEVGADILERRAVAGGRLAELPDGLHVVVEAARDAEGAEAGRDPPEPPLAGVGPGRQRAEVVVVEREGVEPVALGERPRRVDPGEVLPRLAPDGRDELRAEEV